MITLIENGELYAPEPMGQQAVLIDDDKILKVGEVDRKGLDLLRLEYQVIDASGCLVTPGLIDPHEHLLGGSGEDGLSTQSPMIFLSEIVTAGITTVVGVLGVDTTMKTMAGLLARVKGLEEEGLTTRMWSGGYNVPPTTVMGAIRKDMLFIDEIVGAGEIAISDQRSLQQGVPEMAQLVLDTHVGGLLSGKAGITHFHVGEEDSRLAPLRDLLDQYHIEPAWLYPTHIERAEKLIDEAIELAEKGAYVDMDTIEENTPQMVRYYLDNGGPEERLTLSSDAGMDTPHRLFEAFRRCVHEEKMPLERVLRFLTTNTAAVLKLKEKGRIAEHMDDDILILKRDSLDLVHLISRGQHLLRDGRMAVNEHFLDSSSRRISLVGRK